MSRLKTTYSRADSEAILKRLMEAVGVDKIKDLAEKLGLSSGNSVSNAKNTGKIPDWWITTISNNYNISADWLLTGQPPKQRVATFGERSRSIAREGDPLWGRTKRHEINGKKVDITLYQPPFRQPADPDDLTIKAFYTALKLLINDMENSPVNSGWFQREFLSRFPELFNDIQYILKSGGFDLENDKED